eukprot:GEZU01036035.1.p1 GENE.GEZU01036035.1~~GEZU01036035.1.p1  ORF type:complete len:324 (+),score=130.76 GEZU01036035.1:137-1108(+)
MKSILVTGGAGFLGSHMIEYLLEQHPEHKIVCIDNMYTGAAQNLAGFFDNPRFHHFQHNVREKLPENILKEIEELDAIYHMACPASPVHYQNDPIGTLLTCVNGTHNMLELAKERNVPILLTSTSEVYGDPEVHPQPEEYWGHVNCTGPRACYDEGKRAAETLAFDYNRLYQTKIRVARIFNTYGPRMALNDGRIISNFVVQALKNEPITIYSDGLQTRSFCYVKDLIRGLHMLANSQEIGPINIGNPDEHTVKEMAELIKEKCKSSSEIRYFPKPKDDPVCRRPDITKAKTRLGYEPKVSLDEGLEHTIKEFSERLARGATH